LNRGRLRQNTVRPVTTPTDNALETYEMPSAVAEQFQEILRLDERPETLADWADATARRLTDAGLTLGTEELRAQ